MKYKHAVMMVVLTIISCFYRPILPTSVPIYYLAIDTFQYLLLPRYLLYHKEHPQYTNNEIVCLVNQNIDLILTKSWSEYYHNPQLIIEPNTIDVLVNKQHYLPPSYVPDLYNNMRKECYQVLNELLSTSPYPFEIKSSYRSYSYQKTLYAYYQTTETDRDIDAFCLQAGFSEHQTGLTIDLAKPNTPIMEIEAYEGYPWLLENAHLYGFILRYPKGKEAITGIQYEPWHFRYVGKELATLLYTNNWTLEEYHILFKDNY